MRERLVAAAAIVIATWLMPVKIEAHHAAIEWGATQAQAKPFLGIDLEAQRYHHDGASAEVRNLTLAAERQILKRWGLHLRVPFHRIAHDGRAGGGLGNTGLTVKSAWGHITGMSPREETGKTLGLGIGVELPSPNHKNGIGSEHFELTSHLSGLLLYNKTQIYGSVQYLQSLVEAHDETSANTSVGTINFTSPHADRDLFLSAGAAYHLSSSFYLNNALQWEIPQTGGGESLATLSPGLGWKPKNYWLIVALQIPLTSRRWYDYGVNLKLRWD